MPHTCEGRAKRLPTRIGFKRLLAMCDEMLRRRETKEGAVRGTHGRYSWSWFFANHQRVAFRCVIVEL